MAEELQSERQAPTSVPSSAGTYFHHNCQWPPFPTFSFAIFSLFHLTFPAFLSLLTISFPSILVILILSRRRGEVHSPVLSFTCTSTAPGPVGVGCRTQRQTIRRQ